MPAVPVEVFAFFTELAQTAYSGAVILHWHEGVLVEYEFVQKLRVGKHKPVIRVVAG